jgi:hypothetical protein
MPSMYDSLSMTKVNPAKGYLSSEERVNPHGY